MADADATWEDCIRTATSLLRQMPKMAQMNTHETIRDTQKHVDQWLALAAEIRRNAEFEALKFDTIKEKLEKESAM